MRPKKKRNTFQQEIEALFCNQYQLIYRTAYNITRNRADAEDAAQTVFLKLIQGRPSEDFAANPGGYLYRAAKHAAQNIVRTKTRQRLVEGDAARLEIPTVLARASRQEKIQRMLDVMDTMKPHLVEVLKLYYYEELSCPEIAEMTGRSLPQVYVDLFRARTELRKLMGIEEKQNETQKDDHEGSRGTFLAESSEG
jgi:RNA polymerase sigma-70 factor (ECF subfamily)